MKNLILIIALLSYGVAFGQQKKSKKRQPPPLIKEKIEDVPPPTIRETTINNDGDYIIAVPENSLTQIVAEKSNKEIIRFKDPQELESFKLAELKKLTISTKHSNKSLDAGILEKIFDEAIQLEVLEIKNYSIEKFPEIKSPNHHLKELTLSKTNLKAFHPSISNLVALEKFSISNPLQSLPETFSQLKNIEELGLHDVEFSGFPDAIFGLNKLSVLYISSNYSEKLGIKEIPDLFQQIPNLKEFGLKGALLSSLPKSISTLKKLTNVDFSDNEFNEFPEELATNVTLDYVTFTNNPLKYDKFLASIKKIKWRGLFFLNGTGFSKKQYETIKKILTKTDVYYDEMND